MLCCLLAAAIAMAQETLVSGGKNRNMIVYVPQGLPQNRPLLISMHGMNQDANYQRNQANYEAVADTAKFVVVYPDGENKGWDLGSDKDINFLLDIIDEMHRRHAIDLNRVYLSGFSMGGMMTYYAATKIADRIAAFAPVSGYNMGGPNTSSSRPIPIIHTHGTGDDVCVYSSVQSHLDAWVSRNGCNPTPKVEKPKSGPSSTTAELIRYVNGTDGVEVAHLKLPGKGHWHSNDPAMAMTNIEIWNFLSRWSLAAGPQILSVSPEDGCFDMSATNDRTFTFTLDMPADCSKVKANMFDGQDLINLEVQETGFSQTLTVCIPNGKTPKNSEYRLQLQGLYSEDAGKGGTYAGNYTYGVIETGETLVIDTLMTQDWASMRDAIGEGIPFGWNRVNSNSDGTKDEKHSGEANTGGCRMKYFTPGGDFDAGFYFSSREYNRATFTYGEVSGKELSLKRGHYALSFRSAYWNNGAQTNHDKFGLSLISVKNGSAAFTDSSLMPQGCLSENSDQKVTGSAQHEVVVDVLTAGNYLVQYSISNGWNGVVIGPLTVSKRPSQAELYKGEFLRTLHKAQALIAQLNGEEYAAYATMTASLAAVVDNVKDLVSIHPSDYESARQQLLDAMDPLITSVTSPAVSERSTSDASVTYDLLGRRVTPSHKGHLYVKDGKVMMERR